tara:strand:- start:3202 stop:3444 length:243 start_codon:yes stop_codon:yes gene_type:complete
MRWSFGMRYLIATLKDGDDDGWAEAQLIKLAEDLDANNESEDAKLIEVPRHGDALKKDLPTAPSRAMSIPYPPEKKEVTR